MNILVSNDDGINACGIKELVKALSKVANVYVAAPDTQKSASSHALSINGKITVREIPMEGAVRAFQVGGTPADCVKLGLYILQQEGINIDAVYSGVNHGGNLGTDTIYSGTVSAAAEGLFKGLPAVAVSVNSHTPTYFEGACRLAVQVLPKALTSKEKLGVISINTPDIPKEQIRGVKIASLGQVLYHEWFQVEEKKKEDEDGQITYTYSGVAREMDCWEDKADARLIRENYATISAVKYELLDEEGNKEIQSWEIEI